MAPQKDPNFIGSFLLCESINNRAIDSVDNAKALLVNYPAKGACFDGKFIGAIPTNAIEEGISTMDRAETMSAPRTVKGMMQRATSRQVVFVQSKQ